MMHKAAFHLGQRDIILFGDWVLDGPKETFFTCLFFTCLGVLYQGLKCARQRFGRSCKNTRCKRYILSEGHLLQTFLYVIQFLWGYSIMLSVMTFNVWLMVAALAGFGLGYFFFGWAEYEDRSVGGYTQASPEECGKDCKKSCSTSTTQELLLNDGAEIAFKQDESSAILKCNCNDSEM